jgi:beta-xylosidase
MLEQEIPIPPELRNATKEPVVIDEFISPAHERHDPSNIIRYDGKYYIWFTEHLKDSDGFIGCYMLYATSSDGYDWNIQGKALGAGGKGDWDEKGALTGYVVPHDGKFYLFYTGVGPEYTDRMTCKTGIGYAVADTPDGPWERCDAPILWPSDDEWEYLNNDDTNIIFREGKWWLYFKGKPRTSKEVRATKIGLAISDNLTGPYEKHPENPLFDGHALTTWVHRDGVAALTGFGIHGKLLWSEDGVHFITVKNYRNGSTGLYCPQNFRNGINNEGVSWGFDVEYHRPRFIFRFNTNMTVR